MKKFSLKKQENKTILNQKDDIDIILEKANYYIFEGNVNDVLDKNIELLNKNEIKEKIEKLISDYTKKEINLFKENLKIKYAVYLNEKEINNNIEILNKQIK